MSQADKTLDTSFPPIGTTGIDGGNVYVIAVQPDGKILIGGQFTTYNGLEALRLIRLNADGSRDMSFDTGFTVASIQATSGMAVQRIFIQPDGKILIHGSYGYSPLLMRLNSDGSRDTDFNPTTFAGYGINNILLQSDGKILVTTATYYPYLARLNADGSRDTSFDIGNIFSDGMAGDMILQMVNGVEKILVGESKYNSSAVARLMRFNLDGSLDTSFSATGLGA